MTVFHPPQEWNDESLIEHLLSSECSECVMAGHRLRHFVVEATCKHEFMAINPEEGPAYGQCVKCGALAHF